MTRPGSGELPPASPPARFPLFGLAESWIGGRWLNGFGGALGEEVRWVQLAHSSPATGELIMVETHPRPLVDAEELRTGEPALQSVSFHSAHTLVNLTLPNVAIPRPEGLLHALVRHAVQQSERYREWIPVTWQADGVPIPARAWRFAGGWAAFSDALDDVYLAVSSSAGSPDSLALTRLQDGRGYHFDLEQPLDVKVIGASGAAARAGGDQPQRQRADWHPDQLRLIPGHG
jgi:hypothetical protein